MGIQTEPIRPETCVRSKTRNRDPPKAIATEAIPMARVQSKPKEPKTGRADGARAVRAAARREAILAAALDEFSAQGFAAARLDDVAKRAGVAKGTIYLYFADKETLF